MNDMKHLNTEIIAAILNNKVDSKELENYKSHINECDDCFILYSSINSSTNDMNKRPSLELPNSIISFLEKKIIPRNKSLTKFRYISNAYTISALSIAASFLLIFYVGIRNNSDSLLKTDMIVSTDKIDDLSDNNISYYKPVNTRDLNKNNDNRYKTGPLKETTVFVPDLRLYTIEEIKDSLNKSNIKYSIIKNDVEFIQTVPNVGAFFNILKDTLTIFIPNK